MKGIQTNNSSSMMRGGRVWARLKTKLMNKAGGGQAGKAWEDISCVHEGS